eukprot:gene10146-9954_t
MTDAIRYEKGQDQIVVLTLDMPGQSANTMNAAYREAMAATVARLDADKDAIAGVIITSAKKTFFAGGDLNELIKVDKPHAKAFYDMVLGLKAQLRSLETLGKPVVAAINGAALGGGWELCLACQHRVALDHPAVQVGLPEVTLGLLPGGGGVVRMVRMLGLEKALPYLLEGKKISAQKALQAGLIDELAADRDELLAKSRAWILANPTARQPWDIKGHQIPGGTPSNPKVAQMLAIAPSILRSKTNGCFPAPEKILCAAVEGAQVDFDTAHLIETRYFTELTTGQVAKNMIGTFWFQLNEINAGGSRPGGFAPYVTRKVGILGAGMMGAGIAYTSASAGVEVVLKDVTLAAAEKGKAHSAALLDKKVSRGQLTPEQRESTLGANTSDETLARGFDFVLQIKKTPIVVNDSRGFFTSRVFGTFTNEGITLLGEGVAAPMIETEARKAGMPIGPLAISDEVSLSLMSHIRQQTAKDLHAEGKALPEHPAFAVIDLLLNEYKRPGKAAGGGFYEYPNGGQKYLWPELKVRFEKPGQQICAQDVRDRLLFIQAIETVRCVEEGVLMSTADANIGSIFGIGFAAWTGGALQFINQYGLNDFVARARYLAEQYGERFSPPALLLEKAAQGTTF